MTIGELIYELEKFEPSARIYFDFCGFIPGRVASYRGCYKDAALGYMSYSYSGPMIRVETIAQLIRELKFAIDPETSYDGYKGGTYKFNRDTPIHIDNWCDCTHTEIVKLTLEEHFVIIHTEYKNVFY